MELEDIVNEEMLTTEDVNDMLEHTDKGRTKQTIRNCVTVLQKDPVLKKAIKRNELSGRMDIVKEVPWERRNSSPTVTDTDENNLKMYLEENYELTSERVIKAGVDIVSNENKYHPIRDYLESLVWDGIPRIENMLPHFLGAEKSKYTIGVMKMHMLAAISRIYEPGIKYDIMLCLVGSQGAGKSTFSRTLCGLHTNCTGQILWDGKELNAKSRLKRSYMVMQDVSYQLFADTLEKECVFGIKHPDLDTAKQAMERLGIYEYRTHHPNTLSGGQKQRAAVAVSMVCRKDVLIFDEPTSGLDYDSMIQVAGLFQTLSKMGKVIFVVTHDYEFLAAACTRVIHLDNGKQQEDYPLSPDNLHRLHDFFLRPERRQNLEENGK